MPSSLRSWLRGVSTPRPAPAPAWRPSLTRLEYRDNPSGGIDLSFGPNGLRTTDFGNTDSAKAVAVMTNGLIVVAGTTDGGGADFAVARYLPDGTLDPTFGVGGKTTINFGGFDFCTGVAVQPDDKVVLVGYTSNTGGSGQNTNDFALARLTADGKLDTTFTGSGIGGGGRQTTDLGFNDQASAVSILADGKILVAGTQDNLSPNFAVVKYNANGTLDTTFGNAGKGIFNIGANDVCGAMAVQADGKIVLAGTSNAGNTNDFAVIRVTASGAWDFTFNSGNGSVVYNWPSNADDRASGVVIQPDGKIVLAGTVSFGAANANMGLLRLNTDGSFDTSFDSDGRLEVAFSAGADVATGVTRQADGKLVVAGHSDNGSGGANDFAVLRVKADGAIDTTFDGDGKRLVDFGGDDKAYGVALQQDGKIVLAGSSGGNFAVARLIGRDTDLIGRTSGGQWWLNRTTGSSFAVSNVVNWNEGAGWRDVQTADVTGDGLADLIGRTSNGQWWVSVRNGDGTYTTSPWAGWNEAANWRDVKVVDVTGDGRADVVGRESAGGWWVGISNGSAFTTSPTAWAGWNGSLGWQDVQFADFNGDGRTDIAGRVASGAAAGQWWVSVSTGTAFTTTFWAGWNEAAGWRDVRAGDFNGDGLPDIAARTSAGEWWVGTSTGTAFSTTKWVAWNEQAGWRDVRVGDFNGDGLPDIAGRAAGQWWVSVSTGTAFTTSAWAAWNEAAGWRDVRVGDFNGDGRDDIAGRISTGLWYVGTSTGTAFTTSAWAAWNEQAGWRDVVAGVFVG